MKLPALFALAVLVAATITGSAQAGPIRDRLAGQAADPDGFEAQEQGGNAMSCADWERRANRLLRFANARNPGPSPTYRDLAYGEGPLRTLDVFTPGRSAGEPAPIIVMVHGGGWCVGDKAGAGITENKVARWVGKGFIFTSVNYPMITAGSNALAQANDVARAVAYIQRHAGDWGGDPKRVILMGHSAGAHLVSLVNADSRIRQVNGVNPVLGTVSLDAGAIDVVRQMPNVYPFLKLRYREAFGDSERQWIAASPYHQLDRRAAPWLGVCSTTRKDDPCGQARAYAEKSVGLGVKASVLPEAKNHGAINKELGLPGDYTQGVEAFMASLDPAVGRLLR